MILGTKRNESTNQTPQAGEPRPPADTHTAHTDTAQDGSNACHSAPPGFNGRRKRRTKKEMKERKSHISWNKQPFFVLNHLYLPLSSGAYRRWPGALVLQQIHTAPCSAGLLHYLDG